MFVRGSSFALDARQGPIYARIDQRKEYNNSLSFGSFPTIQFVLLRKFYVSSVLINFDCWILSRDSTNAIYKLVDYLLKCKIMEEKFITYKLSFVDSLVLLVDKLLCKRPIT